MSENQNIKILVIDDSVTMLAYICAILRSKKYEFETALNAETALEKAKSQNFDLILLDVILENETGFSVIKKLKSNTNTKKIPIIFLATVSEKSNITTGLELGAVDYIAKPFTSTELLARINVHLNLKFTKDHLHNSLNELLQIKNAVDETAIVVTTDKNGIIISANDKFCKISKYSREELIGKTHQIIKSGYHSKEFFQDLWNTIKNKHVWKGDIRNRAKDGSYYWVATTIIPFLDDTDEVFQYTAIRIDITDRKEMELELQRQRQHLAYILNSLLTGVIQIDLSGQIVYANDAAATILNLERNEIMQRYFNSKEWRQIDENGSPYPPEKLPLAIAMREQRIVTNFIHGIIMDNNEQKWLLVNASPLLDSEGKLQGAIANFINITDQKKVKDTLLEAKEQAEAGNRAKSEFLTTMNHEIRTPLNGVIGFTDLLMKTKLTDTQAHYLGIVNQSANSLLDLLNDILDFSKMEANKLKLRLEKMDLIELVEQTLDIITITTYEKKIEVLINIPQNTPRFIYADPIRLRQILINLLGNAVKFTKEGEIEIILEVNELNSATKDVELLFCIRDTGIGISQENQEKIFKAFSQEDSSTSRKYGGSGLGLAITNQLLGLMNSKLELESELGKGSRFYFTLLVKKGEREEKKEVTHHTISEIQDKEIPIQARPLTRQIKFLIVDDDIVNLFLAESILNQIHPNGIIIEAHNGLEAVEQYNKEKPNIIFMDIQMPEMNGYEATIEIRKNIKEKRIPIIALTAGTTKGDIEKCFLAGMDDYANKPINKELFEKMLEKWLGL